MRYVEVLSRFLIGSVFAVAVIGKVSGRSAFVAFVHSLSRMGVLPAARVGAAARASVAAEALIVVLLVVPFRWAAIAGFTVAAGLLAVLTGAIGISLRRGNRAPCRCFGASASPLGPRHIVRNGVLVAVSFAGLIAAGAPGQLDPAGAIVAAAAGLIAGMAVTAADDIVDLLRPSL